MSDLVVPQILSEIRGETAAAWLASRKRGSPAYDAGIARIPNGLPILRHGELLDLCGPTCGGKTEMVMHAIALRILPAQYGGQEGSVLLLDCDVRFSVTALSNTLRDYIKTRRQLTFGAAANVETIVLAALDRLQVAHPLDPVEFLATLMHAERTFVALSSNPMIVVDSLSVFYWVNRLDDLGEPVQGPKPRLPQSRGPLTYGGSQPSMHRTVIRVLKQIKETYACPFIITRWELFPSKDGQGAQGPQSDTPWAGIVSRYVYVWREEGKLCWKDLGART
ncbi:DNA repair protein xrcc2 [Gaertneriomyces sp. JEL0708]|nr:DNA repair protein xrcc2 [Gaertneriomyces sp. JEL0708]